MPKDLPPELIPTEPRENSIVGGKGAPEKETDTMHLPELPPVFPTIDDEGNLGIVIEGEF